MMPAASVRHDRGVACLALTGCMVGPELPTAANAFAGTYPDRFAPPRPHRRRSAADWWTLYDDATLNGLVATALSDNLDVAFAVARIEEADADLVEAECCRCFLKSIFAALAARSRSSGNVTSPCRSGISNDFRAALSTSFEIDFWGRLAADGRERARPSAGDALREGCRHAFARGLTTQSYFALRSLDAQVTATRENLGRARGLPRHCAAPRRQRSRVGSRSQSGDRSAVRRGRATEGFCPASARLRASAGDADGESFAEPSPGDLGALPGTAGAADGPAVDAARTASGHSLPPRRTWSPRTR